MLQRWVDLLAAPLIWALHFGVVYAIASISIQANGSVTGESRIAIAIASVLLAALIAAVSFWPRADSGPKFFTTIRTSAALITIVAIVWQSLPVILR